jgi:hypothetical protein
MKKITLIALMLFTAFSYAQVGINTNTPDASSALEIESTTGGILIPRLTETQRDDITAPATGLMIYQTDQTAGFYFYDGNVWTKIDGVAGPTGDVGAAGVDGADGEHGATGPAGFDGPAGPAGADGNDGAAGPAGPAGADGADGNDGAAGADGASYTQPTYNIGDIVNGGVVFWLDSTGQHGLVAAFSDVAVNVKWGCLGIDLPNVLNVPYNQFISSSLSGLGAEIGDGFNNTNDILQDCPTAPAALAARSLGAQWFLPSAKELNQMYINKTTLEGVSGFTAFSSYYWSSTESDNDYAWLQSFDNGNQFSYFKFNTDDVRAVRAF